MQMHSYIYIYIYIHRGWVQITLDVTYLDDLVTCKEK